MTNHDFHIDTWVSARKGLCLQFEDALMKYCFKEGIQYQRTGIHKNGWLNWTLYYTISGAKPYGEVVRIEGELKEWMLSLQEETV